MGVWSLSLAIILKNLEKHPWNVENFSLQFVAGMALKVVVGYTGAKKGHVSNSLGYQLI